MNNLFNFGDYVILVGNCSYNRNVTTGKHNVYLCHGKYSMQDNERDADLRVIIEPKIKSITCKQFVDGEFKDITLNKNMVTVISSKTNNIYEVDVDWARSYKDENEYKQNLELKIILANFEDEVLNNLDEDYCEDYY